MNRFDPKTGNPVIIEEESLQITAECQDSKITLPEETLLYSESNKKDYINHWINDRARRRIYEWLSSFGTIDPEREHSKGGLEMFNDGQIIGCLIAQGNSYNDLSVEVKEKEFPNLQNEINMLMSEMFMISFKYYKISTFLLTSLH